MECAILCTRGMLLPTIRGKGGQTKTVCSRGYQKQGDRLEIFLGSVPYQNKCLVSFQTLLSKYTRPYICLC